MDELEKRLIAELQENIPLTENPYLALGERLGISEDEVVRLLRKLKESGRLKRIGAVLRHQRSGYSANAMVVFRLPERDIERTGSELAESPLVSHCYRRAPCDGWPYTLYAMMHGKTDEEIESFVRRFASAHGIDDYRILRSEEELKKSSMLYVER